MTSSLPLTTRAIERCSSARRVLAAVVADCNSLALLLQKVCNKEHDLRATSSVVRALPSHGRGPRFKSLVAHHSPKSFCHRIRYDVSTPTAGCSRNERPLRQPYGCQYCAKR